MTQEWFESADLEKKSPQTKSEIQPDEPEISETVETEPQASQELLSHLKSRKGMRRKLPK